jgi:hypothetical protein
MIDTVCFYTDRQADRELVMRDMIHTNISARLVQMYVRAHAPEAHVDHTTHIYVYNIYRIRIRICTRALEADVDDKTRIRICIYTVYAQIYVHAHALQADVYDSNDGSQQRNRTHPVLGEHLLFRDKHILFGENTSYTHHSPTLMTPTTEAFDRRVQSSFICFTPFIHCIHTHNEGEREIGGKERYYISVFEKEMRYCGKYAN